MLVRNRVLAERRPYALGLAAPLILCVARSIAQPAPPASFNYPPPPTETAPDYFTIAENGKARCVIIHPDGSRPLASTASTLAAWLKAVTGASFQVLSDKTPAPQDMAAIHLGDTGLAAKIDLNLPNVRYGRVSLPNLNGFLILTPAPKTLLIRGLSERAVNHGAASLLMRYAGVRSYWPCQPGGLGAVVPHRPTLRLPKVEWRDWPLFYSRAFSTRPFPPGAHPAIDFYRRNGALPCGENYDDWLPPAKYAKTHPEYYSLVSGKRRVPAEDSGAKGWQPCASNPEVQRAMAQAVSDYFRKNPLAPGVNFSINDGGSDCDCPACRAMDAPGADYSSKTGMSDRYVKLTNIVCDTVTREFPDKVIVYLAYAAAQSAPKTVKPHFALLPVLTSPGNFFAAWDEWRNTGAEVMGIYAHHDDCFFILPKLDLRQMAKRIRYAAASGRSAVFYMELHAQ
ncbi:MAG TPA: DUF4838 domain-containing protein, partial [Candidatus Brocadiia bacterium]|nr:DUF4838 domain-containing protein [Candidatus Brocadiia bacterium]